MGADTRSPSKGNRPEDIDEDPDEADLEIDQANDRMGGPTTGSQHAGLAAPARPDGTAPSRDSGTDKSG